jgi:hypothetical protein
MHLLPAINFVKKKCSVTVQFKQFKAFDRCEMSHKGKHSYSEYAAKQLTKTEIREVDQIVKTNPLIASKEAIAGVSKNTSEIMIPIKDINPILNNKDRVKFKITKSRAKQRIAKRGDFFSEFKNILHKYPGFCVSAEILLSSISYLVLLR